jgi:hypothetical protein
VKTVSEFFPGWFGSFNSCVAEKRFVAGVLNREIIVVWYKSLQKEPGYVS